VDAVLRRAGESTGPLLQPTKGVHIVCPPRGLRTAFLLLHPRDGRVLFIIPWLSGKTLIGTTDTFAEDPERLAVDEVEIAYLLDAYNSYFTPAFRRDEVLACFAGLRPLVRARPGEPSSLSREFRIIRSPSGLITVAGGKYTTYRRMAEVITDHVARRVGCRRRCRTARHRLHGAPELSWLDFEFAATARILQRRLVDEATALHLVRRYGTQASKVVEYVARDPSLGRRLVEDEPEIAAEFAYQRDHEMACQPADFLLRRTRLGLFHPDLEGRLMVPGVTQAP
jgi:glycerol-3-phosphate dehydrogenase